jgi:uncharacterized protein (TIGR00251 family)
MIEFKEKDSVLYFTARVVPRASKSEIVGEYNGALKIRIAALPIDNAANTELINVLAKFFEVPRGSIEILSGENSKTKLMSISGATSEKFELI